MKQYEPSKHNESHLNALLVEAIIRTGGDLESTWYMPNNEVIIVNKAGYVVCISDRFYVTKEKSGTKYLCSAFEFKGMVDLMSTNFGKLDVAYIDLYKASKKSPLVSISKKTTWDAVNELRGDLTGAAYANTHKENYKTLDDYLHVVLTNDYASQPIGSFVIYSANKSARGDVRFICTIEEFNKLVEEMTLGLDVNPVNHGHYLNYVDADKEVLKPAPVIDWDNAPEGATHYWGRSNSFYKFSNFGDDFVFCVDQWDSCSDIECFRDDALIQRPAKKEPNIYTQEMSDNGVKPEVGMKCNIDFIGGNIFTDAELTYLSNTIGCFKCKEGVERSFDVSCINFYPITPPTPLIDGKAYQFDNGDDKGLYGVYDRLHGLFHNRDSYVVRDCTNIKPLTVKGE